MFERGVMRRILKIRTDGFAPVPVAHACLRSRRTLSEHHLPLTETTAQSASARVYSIVRGSARRKHTAGARWLPIALRMRGGMGTFRNRIGLNTLFRCPTFRSREQSQGLTGRVSRLRRGSESKRRIPKCGAIAPFAVSNEALQTPENSRVSLKGRYSAMLEVER